MSAVCLIGAMAAPASAITDGQIDDPTTPMFPQVGGLVVGIDSESDGTYERYRIVCSGTLIGDGTVFLTAAHCIDLNVPSTWTLMMGVTFAPNIAAIENDASPDLSSVTWGVGSAVHPKWRTPTAGDTGDVGVLLLGSAPAGITPADVAPMGTIEAMKAAGTLKAARFPTAGYGTIRDGKQGGSWAIGSNDDRRWAVEGYQSHSRTVLKLSMNSSTGNGGTCYGDSGGPHFAPNGTIVAVTSTGDAPCKNLDTTYRVDSASGYAFLGGIPGALA